MLHEIRTLRIGFFILFFHQSVTVGLFIEVELERLIPNVIAEHFLAFSLAVLHLQVHAFREFGGTL